ncbi:MAG: trimethylamine methyltransferase family protein, partial [Kiloniellales bacterium]
MSETKVATKRRGGRQARRELRAAPTPVEARAVQPGMVGGLYQPLSERDKGRIHRAALDMLERIGLKDAIPSCVELVTAAGGTLNGEGRLLFPRALVEDNLAKAARHFTLHAFDPKHDLEPNGKKVYFGTAGAAVHIVDAETGAYRESTLADLYDIARLVDKMDHIH